MVVARLTLQPAPPSNAGAFEAIALSRSADYVKSFAGSAFFLLWWPHPRPCARYFHSDENRRRSLSAPDCEGSNDGAAAYDTAKLQQWARPIRSTRASIHSWLDERKRALQS